MPIPSSASSCSKAPTKFSVVGLCSGAGGLDLGFEQAGFQHDLAMDNDGWAVKTLAHNRPNWRVEQADLCHFTLGTNLVPDVLLAGVPCQGFSLGGHRQGSDPRNQLYQQVIRIAATNRPRVVVIENVLNLRTMKFPGSSQSFCAKIVADLEACGYRVFHDIFKMCHFGVPQTRRRFIFVAFRDAPPQGYGLPQADPQIATIRPALFDLANDRGEPIDLPNHCPQWGFQSAVHRETGHPFDPKDLVYPVRFSRTASDGHPVRSYDEPFPAIDTATVWGWAQGNLQARREAKDRTQGKHIRNPHANVTLWRVSASRLRAFTPREYARLQTFPDDWEFFGGNKRDIHKQIGNAVPVEFARRLGENIREALNCLDANQPFSSQVGQLALF